MNKKKSKFFRKILRSNLSFSKNPKVDGYQGGLTSMVTSGGAAKNKIISKQQFSEELQKTVIRKFDKRKVYLSFNTIFGVLISWI